MKSNYSVIAIATGIILFALGYGIRSIVGEEFYAKELPWLIIFFEITSIIIHKQMVGSDKDNPKRFPAKFIGIQGLKMFLYMIVLIGVLVIFSNFQGCMTHVRCLMAKTRLQPKAHGK